MAKKNFTDGLEDLLKGSAQKEEVSLFPERKEKGDATSRYRKKSSKDFTADLDTLLQEALQESIEEHSEKKKSKKTAPVAKTKELQRTKRIKHTLSGLDALIRQTLNDSEEEDENPALPKKKRVTFSFDREKVDKLKHIARMEKAYIKDIVSSIVYGYIDEYEKGKNKGK